MLRIHMSLATLLIGTTIVFTAALTSQADDEADKALQSRLIGKWQVDVERTKADLKAKAKLGDDEIEAFTSRLAETRLSFLKEMRLVIDLGANQQRKLTGKTKLQAVDTEKKTIKLLVTPEADDSPPETVFTITFLGEGDDVIVIAAGDEPPLTLTRVKADKKAEGDEDDAQ